MQPAQTQTSPGAPQRIDDTNDVLPAISGLEMASSTLSRTALEHQKRIEREELVSDALRLRWLSLFGAAAWLAFAIQDLMVVRYLHVGSLTYFWGIRAAGLLPIAYVAFRLHSPRPISRPLLTLLDIGIFTVIHAGLTLMCSVYGGIGSRYVTGLMVALLARSSVLAAPWRRGLLVLGTPLLAFPLVFVIVATYEPTIAAQFTNTGDLATFGQSLFVLAASLGLCVWGGHGSWALRRQLFEARNVGKYRLKHCIGRGGMGEVWVAYHTGIHRDVALKILRPDQDANPTSVQRFEQEVEATSRLTHPNTVRVFDYGVTEDGIWYYAMELLEGMTLQELVRQEQQLAVARVLHIAHQVARALAEAHARGIIHRDVKPENIFVTRAGDEPDFVKVLDFGIAKMVHDAQNVTLTHTGAVFGTPAYMSPEAARGQVADARSDVYGVGCTIYFMLTGHPPFTGHSAAEVVLAHAQQPVPPLRLLDGVNAPAALSAVVLRCLAKLPEDRYRDAGELANVLAELQHQLPGLGYTPRSDQVPETLSSNRTSSDRS